MAPAPAIAVVLGLGEDLLREVFVRVPNPEDLIRTAAACKPFLRAIRNPRFLRRFHRLHPYSCPRLLGCLVIGGGPGGAPDFLTSSPSTSSSSSSSTAGLAHAAAYALSFLPGGGWPGDSTWQFLDCRNGRILVKNLVSQELGITDPVSRCYIVLPAPPTQSAIGWGLVADDGDSSVFMVVCISRDADSLHLRAHILTSADLLSWAEVTGIPFPCQPDFVGFRAMQANQSLYWKLEGGERMVAFSTATMEFSMLDLPPSLRELSFDVVDKWEEDRHVLHLLTMSGFCIETWAGTPDGDGGMPWRLVDKSVRFHKSVKEVLPYVRIHQSNLFIIGVAAGAVFVRKWNSLFSIDLQTMKLEVLSKKVAAAVGIFPYTITWPPSFLNPNGQGA